MTAVNNAGDHVGTGKFVENIKLIGFILFLFLPFTQVNSLALDNRCMTSRQRLKETPQDMTRTELFNPLATDEAHLNFNTSSPLRSMVDAGTLERSTAGPMTATKLTAISTHRETPIKSTRVALLTN